MLPKGQSAIRSRPGSAAIRLNPQSALLAAALSPCAHVLSYMNRWPTQFSGRVGTCAVQAPNAGISAAEYGI
eukprot:11044938-Alexandrium_andersonii.AAC.1